MLRQKMEWKGSFGFLGAIWACSVPLLGLLCALLGMLSASMSAQSASKSAQSASKSAQSASNSAPRLAPSSQNPLKTIVLSQVFHTFSKVCFFPQDELLDCIFGALGGYLGTSWPQLGLSWAPLGPNLAPLGLQ